MPPTFTHPHIDQFYAAFWTWFHAHYGIAPLELYGGGARGRTTDESWGGWQRNATGVWVGIGFSGNLGRRRVVKVELYVDDVIGAAWASILAAVQVGSPPATPLWAGLQHHVHRHPRARAANAPGVYCIRDATGVSPLGHAPSAIPGPHGPVPTHASFGCSPKMPLANAVSIERPADAGRICAFHEQAFDLTDEADVLRMADWMHHSLQVYTNALAQLLP